MDSKQADPASPSSSPAHEFSFSISLQSPSTPSAVDLSPADDIFFHGHLLPLHPLPSIDGPHLLSIKDPIINASSYPVGHSFNSCDYTTRTSAARVITPKAKSFSLFGLARRREEEQQEHEKGSGKRLRSELGHFVKRIFSRGRPEDAHFRKKAYSFSGKMSPPASVRTSPADSGTLSSSSPASSDSSMEELQAAIQAAIAHCKDSIAAADKLKA